MHTFVCREEAFPIPQEASIDFHWADFWDQIWYRHIAFSFSNCVPLPPFVSAFSKINVTGICPGLWMGRKGRRGGNKWNINTPVSPYPLSMPSWGYWAEGPISGPSEPCKQHCQNPAPSRPHWLTLQTLCGGDIGPAGQSLAAAWEKYGACQTTACLGCTAGQAPTLPRLVGLYRSGAKSQEAATHQ